MLLLISLTAKVVISKTITQGTGAYPRHQRAEAGGLDPDKSLACHRANTETHNNIHHSIHNLEMLSGFQRNPEMERMEEHRS